MKATTILSALFLTTLIGCEDSSEGKNNNGNNGNNSADTDPGDDTDAGTDTDTDDGDDTDAVADMSWAGSWTVHIDYEVECEYFAQVQTETFSGTWPMILEGPNDALEVALESGWFVLEGSGTNDKLLLSGSFPLDGIWEDAMSGSDNDLFFNGDTVSGPDEASGTLSGSYVEGGGARCDILEATFVMER